jgi:hypothetical protein
MQKGKLFFFPAGKVSCHAGKNARLMGAKESLIAKAFATRILVA